MGMVGGINAPTTGNTFEAFQAKAKSIGGNEPTVRTPNTVHNTNIQLHFSSQESDSGLVTGGLGGVATAGPTATGSSSSGDTNSSVKPLASVGVCSFFMALMSLLL